MTRWPNTIVALHWVSALLIVSLGAAGFVMSDLPVDSATRLLLSRLHTAFGIVLMLLTAGRLVSRLRGPKPDPLPLPALHRRGIAFVHGAMYLALFGLGASGAATGALSAWPDYLQGNQALAPDLHHLASRGLHESLVLALGVLILLHVGGVLNQQLRGGRTLARMGVRSRKTDQSSREKPCR